MEEKDVLRLKDDEWATLVDQICKSGLDKKWQEKVVRGLWLAKEAGIIKEGKEHHTLVEGAFLNINTVTADDSPIMNKIYEEMRPNASWQTITIDLSHVRVIKLDGFEKHGGLQIIPEDRDFVKSRIYGRGVAGSEVKLVGSSELLIEYLEYLEWKFCFDLSCEYEEQLGITPEDTSDIQWHEGQGMAAVDGVWTPWTWEKLMKVSDGNPGGEDPYLLDQMLVIQEMDRRLEQE